MFEPRHEQEVSQDIVLSILGLSKDDKSLATRAVKGAFPCCKLGKKGHLNVYKNIQRKNYFTCTEEINQICEGTNKELEKRKADIHRLSSEYEHMFQDVIDKSEEENCDVNALAHMLYALKLRSNEIVEPRESLVTLYEIEIEELSKTKADESSQLSACQVDAMHEEIKCLEDIVNLGFREGSIDCINGDEIEKLVADFKEKCPLIHAVIQELLVSYSKSKPSVGKSVKRGVHSLALLLTLRNKQLKNDFQLFFGLLCIGYGAGMRFISMLHKMGFCLHWNTLMAYLDKRIENVKKTLKSSSPWKFHLLR